MTEDKVSSENDGCQDAFEKAPSARTPLYATYNSARYQRQDLIQKNSRADGLPTYFLCIG